MKDKALRKALGIREIRKVNPTSSNWMQQYEIVLAQEFEMYGELTGISQRIHENCMDARRNMLKIDLLYEHLGLEYDGEDRINKGPRIRVLKKRKGGG